MNITKLNAPAGIRAVAALLVLTLAATPFAAIGFAKLDSAPSTIAGGTNSDDIDPG